MVMVSIQSIVVLLILNMIHDDDDDLDVHSNVDDNHNYNNNTENKNLSMFSMFLILVMLLCLFDDYFDLVDDGGGGNPKNDLSGKDAVIISFHHLGWFLQSFYHYDLYLKWMKQMNEINTNKQTLLSNWFLWFWLCNLQTKQTKKSIAVNEISKTRKKIQYSNDDDDDCLMTTTIFVVWKFKIQSKTYFVFLIFSPHCCCCLLDYSGFVFFFLFLVLFFCFQKINKTKVSLSFARISSFVLFCFGWKKKGDKYFQIDNLPCCLPKIGIIFFKAIRFWFDLICFK